MTDSAFWDDMAEGYEVRAHPFSLRYARAMLARLPVGPGVRYLDVATGTGAAALAAAELGAEVVAIDFSGKMIERLSARSVRNIDARQMNGQALMLPDTSFDVTVSVFGVMLFEDWNKGLREMNRVTKPGGAAAVVTWKDPNGGGINQMIRQICRDVYPDIKLPPPAAGRIELSDPERLAKAIRDANFDSPNVEVLTEQYHFKLEQIFQGSPWSQRLTPTQQHAVLEEVRRRFEKNRDSGDLHIESEALLAIAKRR
ncbi:MAG: methyltransferase domain-containing protein [Chloroflexi bacterium]|nr:methyltransferase domain-containing protein [Chloroflexota bacterium]